MDQWILLKSKWLACSYSRFFKLLIAWTIFILKRVIGENTQNSQSIQPSYFIMPKYDIHD
jgi:hypothetical protein